MLARWLVNELITSGTCSTGSAKLMWSRSRYRYLNHRTDPPGKFLSHGPQSSIVVTASCTMAPCDDAVISTLTVSPVRAANSKSPGFCRRFISLSSAAVSTLNTLSGNVCPLAKLSTLASSRQPSTDSAILNGQDMAASYDGSTHR